MVLFQSSYTHEPDGREKSPDSRRENHACDGAGGHSGGLLLSRPSVPCRIHEEERPESGVHRGEVQTRLMYKNSAFKRNKEKEEQCMAILKDKYAIIIGDRDGVPGPAIEECAKTAGAKIAYSSTECFV